MVLEGSDYLLNGDRPYGFVYVAANRVNGKVYVGQTTQPVSKRWVQHLFASRHAPHLPFARALAKYGPDTFDLQIRSYATSQKALDMAEQYYIALYGATASNGYNVLSGGSNGKHTEQSRLAMSRARKGRVITPEWRQRLADAGKGRRHRPESIERMRQAQKGRTFSDETRRKMSESAKRRVHGLHPEATKAKIRESNRLRRSKCDGD